MEKVNLKNADFLYVSNDGNDFFSGRNPEKKENDGPFRTIRRALDEIVRIKKKNKGKLKKNIIIMIRGGIYFIDEPLNITHEHSGQDKFFVMIRNYKNEKVIISGGEKLRNWEEKEIEGKNCFVFNLERDIRNFWVNGERKKRARYPKKGYLKIEGLVDEDEKKDWNESVYKIRVKKEDMIEFKDYWNGEVILMTKWVESRLPISSIFPEKYIIEFKRKTVFKPQKDDLYYIENIFEFLDKDRWYYDTKEKKLYFYPENKKQMKWDFIIPKTDVILKITGDPEENKFVENIYFYNLTFSHTEWYSYKMSLRGEDVGGFTQAAIGVPGAIYCEGMKNCKFEKLEISHIGTYGIELSKGCQNNKLINCIFYDLGGGGIKIGEPIIREEEKLHTFGNEIRNCLIKDGGKIFHSSVGIWIGQSYKNKILNNEICDFYYTGISIGWTWGYGESLARHNIVKFNRVCHIGKKKDGDGPILSDMGGIYTLGIQDETIISNNIFCYIYGYWYGGWGIYFDEGSTHIIAENNLVYNTTHGGFHQHYGKENIIRNNIFAFGRQQQIQITRPESHIRFKFERNIVIGDTEKWIEGGFDFNFIFEKNIYWNLKGKEIKFFGLTWEEWRKKGMDVNSLIADPLFYNIRKLDFRLRKNSPAFKLGFKKFKLPE